MIMVLRDTYYIDALVDIHLIMLVDKKKRKKKAANFLSIKDKIK
jgi:hypothetical protein